VAKWTRLELQEYNLQYYDSVKNLKAEIVQFLLDLGASGIELH
jgi:hypothetical protein